MSGSLSLPRGSNKTQPVRLSGNAIARNRNPESMAIFSPAPQSPFDVIQRDLYKMNESSDSIARERNNSSTCKALAQVRNHFNIKPVQPNADFADSKMEECIKREMASFADEIGSRITVFTENGSRFDPQIYLRDHLANLRLKSRRYTDEISSVSRITTEVEELVAKFIMKNTELMVKRAELMHKKVQVQDIEFIRTKRFHELELLKRRKKDIEEREKHEALPRIKCDLKDPDLLCMELAEKLGDTTDDELLSLTQKAHQLRYILGLDR